MSQIVNNVKANLKSFVCSIAYSPMVDKIISSLGVVKIWADLHVYSSKKKLLASAKKAFEEETSVGTFEDYKKALEKHWVSYSEYANMYEFYKKTEEERDEYVSRLKMAYFYWRYTPGVAKAVFRNKTRFLKTFEKYVYRKWIYAPDTSFEDFTKFISKYDCIVKPCDGKLGKGIFKVYKDDKHLDIKKLYHLCVKERKLVEQCIEAHEELKAFHPQSLNTLRVVTVSNKKKAEVFGSLLKMGVGDKVVDNAHAGGLIAQINIKTGEIESEGTNTNGESFTYHPDTKIKIKGYKIPNWNLICKTCCEAAQLIGNPITGWDVAINSSGNIELVEGNYGPDFDGMQSPLQIGVKKSIYAMIKEYCGIEMR